MKQAFAHLNTFSINVVLALNENEYTYDCFGLQHGPIVAVRMTQSLKWYCDLLTLDT